MFCKFPLEVLKLDLGTGVRWRKPEIGQEVHHVEKAFSALPKYTVYNGSILCSLKIWFTSKTIIYIALHTCFVLISIYCI